MVKRESVEGPIDTDRLLTVLEVACILHVSRTLVYWLIQRGELPTVRIHHALRFRPEDVQAYIRKRAHVRAVRQKKRSSERDRD